MSRVQCEHQEGGRAGSTLTSAFKDSEVLKDSSGGRLDISKGCRRSLAKKRFSLICKSASKALISAFPFATEQQDVRNLCSSEGRGSCAEFPGSKRVLDMG